MKDLLQRLKSGASMRYRPRPAGKDQHGVYLFTLSPKARNAMPTLPDCPKALPVRAAAVPHALPGLPALRGKADPENTARVPLAGGQEAGSVPAGAQRLDGAGARRSGDSSACQGACVGCGGVKA